MAAPMSGAGCCGLANLGNTCYMNSALQCLSHTTPFAQLILSQRDGIELQADKGISDMTSALKSLLSQMQESSEAVTPSGFREVLVKKLPQFEGKEQHDSSEFISALLNCLDEELRGSAEKAAPADGSICKPTISEVFELFSGALCNNIRCPECQGNFRHHEQFLCLPLPLPVTDLRTLFVIVLWPLRAQCTQYALQMPWWNCVDDVLQALKELAVLTAPVRLTVVSEHRVRRVLPANHSVSDISPFDKLYAFVLDDLLVTRGDGSLTPPPRPVEHPVANAVVAESSDNHSSGDAGAQRALKRARSEQEAQKQDAETSASGGNIVEEDLRMDNTTESPPPAEMASTPISVCPGSSITNEAIALQPSADAISLPASGAPQVIEMPAPDEVMALPPADDIIALPPPAEAIALPPAGDVIALPPAAEAIALPMPAIAVSAPVPAGPSEEDIQQVCCVCDVVEDVARLALRRCNNQVQEAVILILENPLSVMQGATAVTAEAAVDAPARESTGTPAYASADASTSASLDGPVGEQAGALQLAVVASQEVSPVSVGASGEMVVSAAAASEETPQQRLADAVAVAHVDRVKEALCAGADASATGIAGKPLLHSALTSAIHGRLLEKHVATVRTLLEARADASAKDGSGCSISHHLAESGANALLEELRESGVLELEARDEAGQTLLHKGAAGKHASTVALLLQWGADPAAEDNKKLTAVAVATNVGAEEVLDELLSRPRLLFFVHRLPSEDVTTMRASKLDSGATLDARATALAAKEAGNKCLKEGNYPGAIEQYTIGISTASGSDSDNDICADCYNNRAAVHVQLRNYENVVEDTTQCLERSPLNGKALVRRAQAYQQLEKMKAAYADAATALNTTTLSESFTRMARTVMKEVKESLFADGVDVSCLDSSVPPPVIGAGVSNTQQSRFQFAASPFVLPVPRSCTLSGSELYLLARRSALCEEQDASSTLEFRLRSVSWDAEDDGKEIACDEFAVPLPPSGSTIIAMEWVELPDALKGDLAVIDHPSVAEMRAKEAEKVSLQACLDAFVEERILDDDDAWHCPTCNRKQQATIHTVIERLPSVLVLQLKRFYYTTRRRGKISSLIDFPSRGLDMRPWFFTGSSNESTGGSVASGVDAPITFDLFAVVNHIGGFGGGHYTANAQQSDACAGALSNDGGAADVWHHFNDGVCKPILEEHLVSRDAYILFYRQKSVLS